MSVTKSGKGISLNSSVKKQYLDYIRSFPEAKILVIGDFILDQFIWGKVDRISPEAPVPVVHVEKDSFMLGGSLNVAHNIHNLKGQVFPCGVLGRDLEGRMLRKVISREKIDTGGVVYEQGRPTTVKTRIIAHSQQVVRFDREKAGDVTTQSHKNLLSFIQDRMKHVHVVIIEDYGKGVVEPRFLKKVIGLARQHKKPILVDPKEKNFPHYAGVTTLTPNRKEAYAGAETLRIKSKDLEQTGKALVKKLQTDSLLVTLGEDGMVLFEKSGQVTEIPTAAREVFDVSGAGDTVISVLGLALAVGARMKDAAILANFAAGIVVGKLGTATVSPEELSQAVLNASA